MEFKDIISIISLLGIGGGVGAWIKHLLEKRKETGFKIQNINEEKYRSTLIFMRCLLNPNSIKQFEINDPNFIKLIKSDDVINYLKQKLEEFYYNSLLYASDDVLINIKNFINKPNEDNFFRTALAMRKDLWSKPLKGKIEEWRIITDTSN
jgi:hypothetical protein